jgi:hypothetical protein
MSCAIIDRDKLKKMVSVKSVRISLLGVKGESKDRQKNVLSGFSTGFSDDVTARGNCH